MSWLTRLSHTHTRRDALKSAGAALLPLVVPWRSLPTTDSPIPPNGGTDPYPIPWLDKNGSHNQPAGQNLEPSHIYHFKGRVAQCRAAFAIIGDEVNGRYYDQ